MRARVQERRKEEERGKRERRVREALFMTKASYVEEGCEEREREREREIKRDIWGRESE